MKEKDLGYLKSLNPGETLFKEGDKGEEMYLIKSGKLKITKRLEDTEKKLATLSEGAFFGEMAIIDDKPRSASATAETEVKLIIVNREAFLKKVSENPFIKYIISTLSKRLRKTDEMLRYLSIPNKKIRLVLYLRRNAEENNPGSGVNINTQIQANIEDISDMIGIRTNDTKIILSKLIKYNIVKLNNTIIIKSLKKLQKYEEFLVLKEEFA